MVSSILRVGVGMIIAVGCCLMSLAEVASVGADTGPAQFPLKVPAGSAKMVRPAAPQYPMVAPAMMAPPRPTSFAPGCMPPSCPPPCPPMACQPDCRPGFNPLSALVGLVTFPYRVLSGIFARGEECPPPCPPPNCMPMCPPQYGPACPPPVVKCKPQGMPTAAYNHRPVWQ